jgi:hypothetical protein
MASTTLVARERKYGSKRFAVIVLRALRERAVTYAGDSGKSLVLVRGEGVEAFCRESQARFEGYQRESMKGIETAQIEVVLNPALADRFRRVCDRYGYKRSGAIRQIISDLLTRSRGQPYSDHGRYAQGADRHAGTGLKGAGRSQ